MIRICFLLKILTMKNTTKKYSVWLHYNESVRMDDEYNTYTFFEVLALDNESPEKITNNYKEYHTSHCFEPGDTAYIVIHRFSASEDFDGDCKETYEEPERADYGLWAITSIEKDLEVAKKISKKRYDRYPHDLDLSTQFEKVYVQKVQVSMIETKQNLRDLYNRHLDQENNITG